jgi:3-deoxy-D-manno-octulosonate 8-phosphate phosphatase (KDO 8-P phosphatase)
MKTTNYKKRLHHITTFIFDVDGVLTNGSLLITTDGQLLRTMDIKDGYALKTAIDRGYHICIISGGSNSGVTLRLQALGVTDIYLGEVNKAARLQTYMHQHALQPENVLYMGDDLPDKDAMQQAGLPCCPSDAVPEIKEICAYVSHKRGGNGCVRDVIEQVLKIRGDWEKLIHATHS